MSVIERTGTYGTYYGSPMGASKACTKAQQQVNAKYIYSYLSAKGWTINAISAILGNMQAESSINPGRWQSNNVGGGPAYGIVQWDPYSKYINWATSNGFSDYSTMDANLARIIWEVNNNQQWYGRSEWAGMSFKEFTTSTKSVNYLARGFIICYERPADQSTSAQNYRASLAEEWYSYLTGVTPEPPTPDEPDDPIIPSDSKKRKKYNFLLFQANKRKRLIYDKRRVYKHY